MDTIALGIEQVGSVETFPDHSFGVVHDKARSYFIYADNDEEKLDWMQMFQLCCTCVKGTGRNNQKVLLICTQWEVEEKCFNYLVSPRF